MQIIGFSQLCRKSLMPGVWGVLSSILKLCKSLSLPSQEPIQTFHPIQYPFTNNLHRNIKSPDLCLYSSTIKFPLEAKLTVFAQNTGKASFLHPISLKLYCTSTEFLYWSGVRFVMNYDNCGLFCESNRPIKAGSSQFYEKFYAYNRRLSNSDEEKSDHADRNEEQKLEDHVIDLTESPCTSEDSTESVMSNSRPSKSHHYGPKRRSATRKLENSSAIEKAEGERSQSTEQDIQIFSESEKSKQRGSKIKADSNNDEDCILDDDHESTSTHSRRRSPRRYGPRKHRHSSSCSKELEESAITDGNGKYHESKTAIKQKQTDDKSDVRHGHDGGVTENSSSQSRQSPGPSNSRQSPNVSKSRRSPRLLTSTETANYEWESGEIQEIFASSGEVNKTTEQTPRKFKYGPRRRSARNSSSRNSTHSEIETSVPEIQVIASPSLQSASNFGPIRRSPRAARTSREDEVHEFEQLENESKHSRRRSKYGPKRRSERGKQGYFDKNEDGKILVAPTHVSPEIIVLDSDSDSTSKQDRGSSDVESVSPVSGKRKRERQNSAKSECKKGKSSSVSDYRHEINYDSLDDNVNTNSKESMDSMIDLTGDCKSLSSGTEEGIFNDPAVLGVGPECVDISQAYLGHAEGTKSSGKDRNDTGKSDGLQYYSEQPHYMDLIDPAIIKVGPECPEAGRNKPDQYNTGNAGSSSSQYQSSKDHNQRGQHKLQWSTSLSSEPWISVEARQQYSSERHSSTATEPVSNETLTDSQSQSELEGSTRAAGKDGGEQAWAGDGDWNDESASWSQWKTEALRSRKWITTSYGVGEYAKYQEKRRRHFLEFTIGSYNVLAQNLLEDHPHLYTYCPPLYLDWKFRSQNLMDEIAQLRPDVLCMQEVVAEHYNQFFLPEMEKLGYGGVYKKKTGYKHDGCATFYLQEKFELDASLPVDYFYPGVSILDRDNIGLVVRLGVRGSQSEKNKIVVGNTHLLFNPRRGDIKLAQLMLLLAGIDQLACSHVPQLGEEHYYPILLCGDYNSEPHSDLYKFVARGSLKYEGLISRKICGQSDCGWRDHYLSRVLVPPYVGLTDKCQFVKVVRSREDLCSERKRMAKIALEVEERQGDISSGPSESQESDASVNDRSLAEAFEIQSEGSPASDPELSPVAEGVNEAADDAGTTSQSTDNTGAAEMFPGQNSLNQFGWPLETATSEHYCQGTGTLSHKLELLSVYEHMMRNSQGRIEKEVTSCHNNTNSTVDFIFYSVHSKTTRVKKHKVVSKNVKEGRLRLLSKLALLAETDMYNIGGLPNEIVSSDHIVLLAKFAFKLK